MLVISATLTLVGNQAWPPEGFPLRTVPKAGRVRTADAHMPVRRQGPAAPQELTAAKPTQEPGAGSRWPAPGRAPPPHPAPTPLTLDLLVDHQGEVVHLQDA